MKQEVWDKSALVPSAVCVCIRPQDEILFITIQGPRGAVMRIIAALHVDASLLKSSGTASNQVHLLYTEGKLHIDCNLCVFAGISVCVCVFPVSEHVASFDDEPKRELERAEGRQTERKLKFRDRRVHSVQVSLSVFRCMNGTSCPGRPVVIPGSSHIDVLSHI